MDIDAMPQRKVHHGQNVKRLREILNIKQDALAKKMGQSQQTLSRYETMEKLDDELLEKIAKELNIPVEAIKNFDEEKAINIVSNTFQDEAVSYIAPYKCTFNPIEVVRELYERIIKEKDEKYNLLEQILKEKK
ncbi:MAG: helix-turn-helix domain-containing protein [Candidatus Symbiothrix sp.]|jgi:transcriptional regulator with XRE-family HTH domain|nr:helix-turn-helix domain-containing protein [Candidatus Symbiothrix sp.]